MLFAKIRKKERNFRFSLFLTKIKFFSAIIREMENISYHVASGAIDKDLLFEVISSVINEPDINEEIKLKIFEAISNHES